VKYLNQFSLWSLTQKGTNTPDITYMGSHEKSAGLTCVSQAGLLTPYNRGRFNRTSECALNHHV